VCPETRIHVGVASDCPQCPVPSVPSPVSRPQCPPGVPQPSNGRGKRGDSVKSSGGTEPCAPKHEFTSASRQTVPSVPFPVSPYLPQDAVVFCPQLLYDMAGSWNPANNSANPPSAFLSSLTSAWSSSSYGGYWLAAAGTYCQQSPYRNLTSQSTGCPNTNPLSFDSFSDGVVCADSAQYSNSYPPGELNTRAPIPRENSGENSGTDGGRTRGRGRTRGQTGRYPADGAC
jgi:hypothetical protein